MYHVIKMFFGCHHRRITRPMTPVHKANEKPGVTYVVCLDCGQQFYYDLTEMRIGTLIPHAGNLAGAGQFQTPN